MLQWLSQLAQPARRARVTFGGAIGIAHAQQELPQENGGELADALCVCACGHLSRTCSACCTGQPLTRCLPASKLRSFPGAGVAAPAPAPARLPSQSAPPFGLRNSACQECRCCARDSRQAPTSSALQGAAAELGARGGGLTSACTLSDTAAPQLGCACACEHSPVASANLYLRSEVRIETKPIRCACASPLVRICISRTSSRVCASHWARRARFQGGGLGRSLARVPEFGGGAAKGLPCTRDIQARDLQGLPPPTRITGPGAQTQQQCTSR